jgi:hypothetical protein
MEDASGSGRDGRAGAAHIKVRTRKLGKTEKVWCISALWLLVGNRLIPLGEEEHTASD